MGLSLLIKLKNGKKNKKKEKVEGDWNRNLLMLMGFEYICGDGAGAIVQPK